MKEMITVADKKRFIHWFLEHFNLKNPEAEWLLQYVASNENLLARTHFTDRFQRSPKALFMSTTCVNMTAFKFYKNRRVTSDVEKAFLDLHNHPNEDLYITLYFRDRAHSPEYASVIEGQETESPILSQKDVMLGLEAEMWLDKVQFEHHCAVLRKNIDEALDRGDRDAFLQLTSQYKALLETQA